MEIRSPVAFLLDLDLIKQVLVKDFDHFVNRRTGTGGSGKNVNDPTLFHKMLISMDNQEWKDLRATLSPTFTTGKIRRMFKVFVESSEKMSNFLTTEMKQSSHSSEIDLKDVFGRYTLDVIAATAFGVNSHNFKDKDSVFAHYGHRLKTKLVSYGGMLKIFLMLFVPFVFKLFRLTAIDYESFEFFKTVALKSIKHRDETGERRNDFLQLLMDARSVQNGRDDEDDEDAQEEVHENSARQKIALTNDLLVAQCVLFFFAGIDTIESLLMFAANELAVHPEIQSKLAKELKDAVDEHGDLNYDVVNQLEYLDMVISETLRKYPPAPRTERKCSKDYKIPKSNVEIKKGQNVIIPIWSIHHDPEFYPDPEKFIPERFSKENKAERNPYAYMPFGAGPRNCIGNRFAITEGKAAIAHLVLQFVLQPSTKTTIPMKCVSSLASSLKPADGMWLNVSPRK